MRTTAITLTLLAVLSCAVYAAQPAPRVLSPHNADAYSMKTFAQFDRWKDLKGEAKAYEVFKYLADTRTGIFPMGAGAWEGKDVMYDYGFIRDPVKMINVYTCGYCDMLGPTMEGVMKDMGIGPARTVNMPKISHVVCEVNTDGKWHYLDLDLRACFRRDDGTLGSVEESRQDHSLWKPPADRKLFFPLDNLANVERDYKKTDLAYRYGVNMGGSTMDYLLRQGETLTRWWKPQGLRWNHYESYSKGAMLGILNREPKGPKGKHDAFSIHRNGNGCFVYKPNLTDKSTDFADGCYDSKNVAPGAEGIQFKGTDSFVIFEVRSPYVIVPSVNNYDTTDDDTEASVVKLDGQTVAAYVSTDNGLTWKGAPLTNGSVDLTALVARTYGYLLKLTPSGTDGQALVKGLEITTWVQLHPASLPSLRKGANKMQYVTGDHYGLPGRVVEIRPNGNDKDDLLKYLSEPPKDYDPKRTTNRIHGRFVAKVQAPPNTKIAWFSGGGNFTAQQADNGPKTRNTMAYAVDESKDFKQFYKADIPAGQGHWHYNADVEVKLDKPAKTVFIEYVGDPGVNNIRIYAHCVPDQAPAAQVVNITHRWTEKGAAKTKTVTLNKPGSYEITADDDPVDDSIEISVPSVKK